MNCQRTDEPIDMRLNRDLTTNLKWELKPFIWKFVYVSLLYFKVYTLTFFRQKNSVSKNDPWSVKKWSDFNANQGSNSLSLRKYPVAKWSKLNHSTIRRSTLQFQIARLSEFAPPFRNCLTNFIRFLVIHEKNISTSNIFHRIEHVLFGIIWWKK